MTMNEGSKQQEQAEDARRSSAKADLKPQTSQDQVLVEATGMDLQAAHQADESSRAQSFMEKYRSRTFDARRHEAFHEFFELAAMLNESALALGITQVSLNAEGGEVNVTYQSQKVAHAPTGAKR